MSNQPGYTLPVFACAGAIAAWRHLHQELNLDTVEVNLLKPTQTVAIAIEQVAKISSQTAIAITRSDPGNHLDITRNTPVWALVEVRPWQCQTSTARIEIRGGEGVGRQSGNQDRAAIYSYARELITANLTPLLDKQESTIVTIILPEGRRLAERTSNAAFGVLEGLSLLGTTGIVQPLVAPEQLAAYQADLATKAAKFDSLVFCLGENGLDLAQKAGINRQRIVKTANWVGSMLVAAALAGVKSILLFGYHGKLIKLAGGIFHTHNHLADGRLEIFTAHCARLGLSTPYLQQIFHCSTTEAALDVLRDLDRELGTNWVRTVYEAIALSIEQRSQAYIHKYTEQNLAIGSILFDRHRQIIYQSDRALFLLADLC